MGSGDVTFLKGLFGGLLQVTPNIHLYTINLTRPNCPTLCRKNVMKKPN
jgi:hypothetical protein